MSQASSLPQLPVPGSFLASIRSSSSHLRQTSNISINYEAIKRLLVSPTFTSSFERVSASHGLALPLKFPSALSELNLLSVLALLNFGSGYRVPLHAQTGRGAWDNIRALVFSLYITSSIGGEGDLLSAKGMRATGDQKIAELMGVSVHVERPHETIPGLTVGELGGPIYELVKLIATVFNETGEVLLSMGYPDLGSFVLEALKEGGRARPDGDGSVDVDVVLERLVRAIPAFRDMAQINGQPIYCFKKALFLIHAVAVRFGSSSPPPFPIPKTTLSPVFADNVLPSILVHLGVIDLSNASHSLSSIFPGAGSTDSLTHLLAAAPSQADPNSATVMKEVPKEGPVLTTDQAYALRAASIDACESIVEVAQSLEIESAEQASTIGLIKGITLPQLDMWLWAVAKDRPDYRKLERFVLRDTVFF